MALLAARTSSVGIAVLVCVACTSESALTEPVATVATPSSTVPSSSSPGTTPVGSVGAPGATPTPTDPALDETEPFAGNSASTASDVSSGANDASERDSSSGFEPAEGDTAEGDAALAALEIFLGEPRASRPPLGEQAFAQVPLTKAQSDAARELLWEAHVALIREERAAEHSQKSLTLGSATLRYDYTTFGDAPADGRSLYISLHGGGEAAASVNDSQWENQKILYQPDEGIYLSPRAPTDTWNMWHQDHIDPLFERLIENFVVLAGVNPNRVYVMGYSAGGDGVYQLGPRMADHWAAASAMAGHPNEAKPLSLRNIGFTIHVGGQDTAFDRNLVAVEWREQLEQLQAADPMGYAHVVEVHAGKPHWMDLEDAVAVPWMAAFTRNPNPTRVVWYQDDILHDRFYWLRDLQPSKETLVTAELSGQQVTIESDDVAELAVMLSDALLDLDAPVTVTWGGAAVSEGRVPRTIGNLHATLVERGDPALMFPAQVVVRAP